MRVLRSSWLVIIASVVVVTLFWFRPGGIDGPRATPVKAEGKGFDHGAFTAVLQKVVGSDGQVDYAALRSDPGGLDRYLGQLAMTSPTSAPHRFKSEDEQLAYYIDAYNAFVLAAVRDLCPIETVQDAYWGNGLFWRVSFIMGGEPITLSDLESSHIRRLKGSDPEVHFALVKGARGFPALPREAYTGVDVRPRLKALGDRVVADPQMLRREGRVLHANELFLWYESDFAPPATTDSPVRDWLQRRAPALVEGDLVKIEHRPFDWTLNGRCL